MGKKYAIEITSDIFTVTKMSGIFRKKTEIIKIIDRNRITRVEFYKRDEITTDLICCDIEHEDSGEIFTCFIHEEISGFTDCISWLEDLPNFNREWRNYVIQPPFEENRFVAFLRERDKLTY